VIRMLDRYMTREFLRLFFLFVLAAPILFILGDLMDNLDRYMSRGLSSRELALGYLYQAPLFILYSFPIAALIASVFTVNAMTRYSEVSAAKASGISFFRVFLPLPVLGVLLALAALGLSEIVPIATQKRIVVMRERVQPRSSRSDFIYRAADGMVLAIRRLDVDGSHTSQMTLEREGNEPVTPTLHVSAQRATWAAGQGWTLETGAMRLFFDRNIERSITFETLHLPRLTETPEQLLAEPKDPEEMRYAELGEFIQIIQRSGGEPLKLMVEHAQKIALPVATFVIVLFAMPLATSSRRGGSAYGVGVSLAITIVYLMLFKVAAAAGASGALDPVVAAWIPNILVASCALILMLRVRT